MPVSGVRRRLYYPAPVRSGRVRLGEPPAHPLLGPRGRPRWDAAAPATVLPPRTLHPYPNHIVWGPGGQSLRREVALGVSHDADPGVVTMMKETWRQFTFGAVK